ncbi:hypothetical protein MMC34_002048 [Xylographa carneopallida]|nr:hypothetical protein [Xylographa carneopallida]
MDFREVCEVFGGTIFFEEPRSNFATAYGQIEHREESLTEASDDERAAILLLKAIHAALVGSLFGDDESPKFLRYMRPLYEGEFGPRWEFRIKAYNVLVSSWQFYPPLFRFCSLERGPMAMLLNTISQAHVHNSRLVRELLDLVNEVDPLDELEFRIIREVWTLSHRALEAARMSNPSYLYHAFGCNNSNHKPEVFENCCSRLADVSELAEALNFDTISNYAQRLIFEVRQAQGSPDCSNLLNNPKKRYEATNDEVGIGICFILQADSLVSGPFTNPTALNLLPVDGWDYLGSDTNLSELNYIPTPPKGYSLNRESLTKDVSDLSKELGSMHLRETSKTTNDNRERETAVSAAISCYSKAEEIFLRAGAVRGQGLAIARRACTLLIQELLSRSYWDDRDKSILDEIKSLFEQSCELFENAGDIVLVKLTQMHLILLASHGNNDIYQVKHAIGEWGYENGNWTYAAQLGLLAFRLGDHLRYECGSSSKARLSYECASSVLSKLQNQGTAFFQLQCAIVSLLLSTSSSKAGKLYVQLAKFSFEQRVKVELEKAAEQDPSWSSAIGYFAMVLADLLIASCQKWENATTMREVCSEQLKLVESHDSKPGSLEWLKRKRAVIQIYALISEYQEDLDRGDWELGESKLTDFLGYTNISEDEDNDTKLARIDVCLHLREFDMAQDLLKTVDVHELLTEFRMGLASLPNPEDTLYARRRSIKAYEGILKRCISARDWKKAAELVELLESLSPDHFEYPGNYSCVEPWQRFLWIGLLQESQGSYELSFHSFRRSFLVFHHEWISVSDQDQRQSQLNHEDFNRIATALARFHLRRHNTAAPVLCISSRKVDRTKIRVIEQWNTDINLSKDGGQVDALEALERGKALSIAASLSFKAESSIADVREWDCTHHRFRTWLDLLTLGRPRNEDEEKEYQLLDKSALELELGANPLNVDRRPLSEQVLEYPDVLEGIPDDTVVIYYSLSEDGLALLSIARTGILSAIWNPYISASATRQMVCRYVGSIAKYKDSAPEDWLISLALSMSEVFIEPVEVDIETRSQVIFVPSGDLARFPLGALYMNNIPLTLQKAVFQVPSLSALFHLRERPIGTQTRVSVIARPGDIKDDGEAALPMAGIEALLVGQIFGSIPLDASGVSKNKFREELEGCSIMHLSTHGYFDTSAPMLSHISLQERFRVIDMLTVRTKAVLVIFSACVSGTGVTNKGDDVLGFSHAVLAAGARVYVGALWTANDLVTMIHMIMFYLELASTTEPRRLADIWGQATRILYFARPYHIKGLLEGYLKRWDDIEAAGLLPNQFVRNGRRKLQKAIDEWITPSGEPVLDLTHPYYWANFAMVGNASIMMHAAPKLD